jgi:serine/threonine protein phosphatase PrpC
MIYTYGVSMQGTYHIKDNIVCQDAYEIIKCGNDMVIAAVADGLGSAEFSDVASKIAVCVSTGYCKKNVFDAKSSENILNVIKKSFSAAQRAIEKEANKQHHDVKEYDTTLSLAIMLNNLLFFGHSGDSGIVALTTEGLYVKVTEQQRDDYNFVFPLCFEDKWVFGKCEKNICSVFLATDGMLEPLFPLFIRNEAVNIHINLARYFMDNKVLRIDKKNGEQKVQAKIKEFIQNIPDEKVNDDKTVVVLVNTSVKPKSQPKEYYQEPDWAILKQKHDEEWKRQAYPHLFKNKSNDDSKKLTSLDNVVKTNINANPNGADRPEKLSDTKEKDRDNDTLEENNSMNLKPDKRKRISIFRLMK